MCLKVKVSTIKLYALLFFLALSGGLFAQSRNDGAVKVDISESNYNGSLQNGSWSPDNQYLMATNWGGGYNNNPANIFIVDLSDYSIRALTTDGESNVNMPGCTWNPVTNMVVFSSEHSGGGDQVHIMNPNGQPGTATRVTNWNDPMCWEPGFSPDGEWVVYEAHYTNNINNGVIEIYKIDGTIGPITLTATNNDCRQPSWSPIGDKILCQRRQGNSWDIWTINTDGSSPQNLTENDPGDKTDASFSPDGQWIVYSTGNGELPFANIYIKNLINGKLVRVTNYSGYDGAPSWSTDGRIVFESTPSDPDGSNGATLWVINTPVSIKVERTLQAAINGSFSVFPNPSTSTVKIRLNNFLSFIRSQRSGNQLKIFNIKGELVDIMDIDNMALNAGITWNANQVSSGKYIVRFCDGNHIYGKTFLLVK
jgi:TolB protein